MNVLLRELRSNLIPLIVWTFSLGAVVMIAMLEYEAFADSPEMQRFLEAFPPEMLAAFGMTTSNLTTLPGFLSMFSIYFYLTMSIHAGLLGVGIINKEERDKTAEFLYTLPISRNSVLLQKVISAVINVILFNVLTMGITVLASLRYEPNAEFYEYLILLAIGIMMTQLIFLAIGLALSSFMKDHKLPGRIAIAVVMVTWFLSTIVNMIEDLEFLKYFTPFQYFDSARLVDEMSFDIIYFILSGIVMIVSLYFVFTEYKKRDLSI